MTEMAKQQSELLTGFYETYGTVDPRQLGAPYTNINAWLLPHTTFVLLEGFSSGMSFSVETIRHMEAIPPKISLGLEVRR